MKLRRIARWVVPVGVADLLRGRSTTTHFRVAEDGWPAFSDEQTPWNDERIASTLAERWPQFVEALSGTAPLDLAHEASAPGSRNMPFHNTYMTFGYVLARTSRMRERFSVMDWGGGLGHYHVLSEALLPELELEYHVKDTPAMCAEGRRVLPVVHFHEDDECLSRPYDLVMASGSLHCVEEWRAAARRLAHAAGGYLYVTRLPLLLDHETVAVVQDARPHGFDADVPLWFLNRAEFLAHMADCGMTLIREFYIDEVQRAQDIDEPAEMRGFLFRPAG